MGYDQTVFSINVSWVLDWLERLNFLCLYWLCVVCSILIDTAFWHFSFLHQTFSLINGLHVPVKCIFAQVFSLGKVTFRGLRQKCRER